MSTTTREPERKGWRALIPGGQLRALPLRSHLRGYTADAFRHDLLAGINVAIPAAAQGMAFAMIAGLPREASGVLCSAVAAFFGAFFVSSRFTILGPTNATALMIFSATAGLAGGIDPALVLSGVVLLSGLLLIAGAGLRMADMVQYISRSVIVGYITGAALLIAAGQLRPALGIESGDRAKTFFGMIAVFFQNLSHIQPASLFISAGSIAAYLLLRRRCPRVPAFAVVLAAVSCVFAVLVKFKIFNPASPVAALKPFTFEQLLPALPGITLHQAMDALSVLFGPATALAFLAALENTVMGKAQAGSSGGRVNHNQDLLACGLANIGCAFAGGMPASASLTRSGLNQTSGARTPVSSLICGLLCFAAALLLGPVMPFIPRPALAALVICVAASLLNWRHLRICWRATRSDATTLAVTILSTLIMPLHVAIFMGVATSIILYLRKASRPMLVEYEFNNEGTLQEKAAEAHRQHPAISIVHVEGELFFGAAELFRTQIQRTARDENLRVIILRMKNARHLDATSVMALEELITYLRKSGRHLLISGLSKEVYRVLRKSGMVEVVGRDNLFMGSAANPNISTRNALKRAQVLLGTRDAEIRIFYDPSKPQG